jgi:hypothetical protein
LESGLEEKVNAMIENNAIDVLQSNSINQYATSLRWTESAMY